MDLAPVWPLHPTSGDILVRLGLTVLASALMGFNRGSHGHAAGIRTTILVGVAAAIAMIQANVLLSSSGRPPDSFVTLDLMRLPLGILTGVGFIGGGVILKRGGTVTGVTTAATLWIVTAVGLCFGGGQLGLGVTATVVAMVALYLLKMVDLRIPRLRRASLEIVADARAEPPDLNAVVLPFGCQARFLRQSCGAEREPTHLWYEVRWSQADVQGPNLRFLTAVASTYRIASFAIRAESDD